jgi:hypothetical protein
MEDTGVLVTHVVLTLAIVAGFGPLLGALAGKAAGLAISYRRWLRASALGWLVGQAQLALVIGAGVVSGLLSVSATPFEASHALLGASMLAVGPCVAVGVFIAIALELRERRDAPLPSVDQIRLRERYALGEIDLGEFERKVARLIAREPNV